MAKLKRDLLRRGKGRQGWEALPGWDLLRRGKGRQGWEALPGRDDKIKGRPSAPGFRGRAPFSARPPDL